MTKKISAFWAAAFALSASVLPAQVVHAEDAQKAVAAEQGQAPKPVELATEKASIQIQGGGAHDFELEVAKTHDELETGLMYRKEMAKDHGMLFELGTEPQLTAFWMKNTYISLDIVFVAADGTIVCIQRNAVPLSLDPIPSMKPVTGVIELIGGRANELGLSVGDKVVHPYFKAE